MPRRHGPVRRYDGSSQMRSNDPCDYKAESVDWGAPGDARHAWKGKFFTA